MNEGTHLFQSQESTYINLVYIALEELESGFLRSGQTGICVVLSLFTILSAMFVIKPSSLSPELYLLNFAF